MKTYIVTVVVEDLADSNADHVGSTIRSALDSAGLMSGANSQTMRAYTPTVNSAHDDGPSSYIDEEKHPGEECPACGIYFPDVE